MWLQAHSLPLCPETVKVLWGERRERAAVRHLKTHSSSQS